MAEPFSAALARLTERVRQARGVDCFLDLDGTLAPLVDDPEAVALLPGIPALLRRLHRPPLASVAIVSGRSLAGLKGFFPEDDGFALAGNHGMEILCNGERRVHAEATEARETLAVLAATLRARLGGIPGCVLEDKGLSLTVHVRRTPRDRLDQVRAAVWEAVEGLGTAGRLAIRPGKEVLEVRPARAGDKGTAVRWLMRHRRGPAWRGRFLPVYVGDDRTDEDAFRSLGDAGLTVRVGPGPTAARYFLEAPEEVPGLLTWLAEQIEGRGKA